MEKKEIESLAKKFIFPLYHGTDLRIVKMTEEERASYRKDCIKVSEYLWSIYKESYDAIIDGKYKSILGETGWHNLANAIIMCSANHNNNEQYQYNTFHLAKSRIKAENFAISSFAFGEIGLIAYRMYDAARILKIQIADKDVQTAADRIANFAEDDDNFQPVIFEMQDLDIDSMTMERFGSVEDCIKNNDKSMLDCIFTDAIIRYSGTLRLNPTKAIFL